MEWSFPDNFFKHQSSSLREFFKEQKPVWKCLDDLKRLFINQTNLIESEIHSSVVLMNPESIRIGKQCIIHPYSVIEGPCIIKDHVEIGPHAFIRKYSYLDSNAKVGHSSEIKGSILLPYSKAPHFNYVGDSILGFHVNLGAGVVCANFKLNKTPINIKHPKETFPTGLIKCGAIIGDGSFLGCNSVTSPGTLLKKNFQCLPCSNIFGVHL